MQIDWLFTGILPDYDGFFLFIVLGTPVIIFSLLVWQMDEKVKLSVGSDIKMSSRFVASYRVHSREWNIVHKLLMYLTDIIISLWFLFVFGFVAALVAFIVIAIYGKRNQSLSEII